MGKALKYYRVLAANIQAIEKATIAAGGFLVQMFTDGNRVLERGNCDKFFQKARASCSSCKISIHQFVE